MHALKIVNQLCRWKWALRLTSLYSKDPVSVYDIAGGFLEHQADFDGPDSSRSARWTALSVVPCLFFVDPNEDKGMNLFRSFLLYIERARTEP